MKKIAAIIILMALGLNAAQINWVYTYKEASTKAIAENKPMVVYMHRPGCESCDFLEAKVFKDEALAAYVNEHYVPALLNVSKSDAPNHLVVKASPVFHFVNGKGEFIEETLYGGKNAKSFLKILQDVEIKFSQKK
ncbi:MAG TPA: thioredoxin family protein [Sulfuricurvum sp.]|nr:thioredoxin family protein [Sulfuricurvum sp.]